MPGALSVLVRQLGVLWKHFGVNQKISIVMALLVTLAAVGAILYGASRPDFRLLCTGLTLEDAARSRELLEEERIPVQLREHGRALYVPASDVYRARLLLASAGLPKDSSAGFELFEQPKFGLTEFAQQVNYQRALQGELERTIVSVDGVRAARIMLVMPRDRLFVSDRDKSASASIMLTLQRGVRLAPEQVHSIRQLVGTAVPGLSGGHVTITDHQGNLLSDATRTADPLLGIGKRQLDVRRAVEEELARKAQDMLDLSLGLGQAIVRVSADIDFRRIERHNETYDPEGRVLIRETISSESSSDPARAALGGVARVAVGDPSNLTVEPQAMGQTRREDVDSEYRVPTGRETMVDQGGRVERLSVSVSVARGEEPRDAEALQTIERMVRSAVGTVQTPQRQDVVEVLEMAFAPLADPLTPSAWPWWDQLPFSPFGAVRVLGGLILLLVLYGAGRRVVRQLSVERETVGTPVSMLAGAEGGLRPLAEGGADLEPSEKESELDYISRLAEHNPAAVATWIDQTVRSKG